MIDNNLLISIILYFISIYFSSLMLKEYKKYDLKSSYYYAIGFMFCAGIYLINTILRIVYLQG